MHKSSLRKALSIVAAITALLLLIPLLGMQFTSHFEWGPEDFVLAACLLFGTGAAMVLVHRHVERMSHRVALIGVLALALAAVWAELAVGILT